MNGPQDESRAVYALLPTDIPGFEGLAELALDLRGSWNHAADALWRQLDPALWELTHNPWVVLQTVSRESIQGTLADARLRRTLDDLLAAQRARAAAPAWFQQRYPKSPLTCAAYFSMEYMLSEALPIYSGGLGNVAGDQLKAAGDLGVPVVAVGLLYQQGYFRQVIDKEGAQEAFYPYNDPGQLPITPVRRPNGERLRLEIALPGYSLWLRAWQAKVGRLKLYLLDSNDAANLPAHRTITSELYGGGPELRLKQEIILGICGWRLLTALGLKPEVCHLNEGHAAFAVLERARAFMAENPQPFEAALAATRPGNVFTTHTAVAAGFDHFEPALMERFLGNYAKDKLGIGFGDLMALGRQNPGDAAEHFNMAYLAVRGSGAVNAVSRLHGQVSRRLFAPLFPRWPEDDVPIGHITNGVHMPTWGSAASDALWTQACGKGLWRGPSQTLEDAIRRVPDAELWKSRAAARKGLIDYARERLARHLAAAGAAPEAIEQARHLFDPNALTLGFARRFAAYKRPNLLLHDPDRLLRLLSDPKRPVQLILAGKAHPGDVKGQALVQEWVRFVRRPEVRPHAIFLSDYDMLLTERLVQGVDLWLNTPLRPWEACGTSGMKVLVNGGINLSELDGWWAEAYSPDLGWSLGDGKEHGDDPALEAADAGALYDILEHEVIPEFYTRGDDGVPMTWTRRMRESMARLTPAFSADRAVREYVEQRYIPAAAAYAARAADKGAAAKALLEWRRAVEKDWAGVHFGGVKVDSNVDRHAFEVELYTGALDPKWVRVEIYDNGALNGACVRQAAARVGPLPGAPGGYVFSASVPAGRPAGDYTARALPCLEGAEVPLEEASILWQR